MHKHTYETIVSSINYTLKGSRSFVLKKLETRKYKTATYDLVYIANKRPYPKRPHVLLMGTLHGEEPAGAAALSGHLDELLAAAQKSKVSLTIIPCGNPFGLDRGARNAPGFKYMNGGFCHHELVPLPKGSAAMKRFLAKSRPTHYLDLHEDFESKGVYVYAFKNRSIAEKLLAVSTEHIPIEQNPKMDDRDIRNADIQAGIVFDAHDGTTEDCISHQKQCVFSGALETPSSRFSLRTRARVQANAALELIRLAGRK